MQKNKFTTYLLYAIGEIFLVVIGILIAVSINDWNERQKNRTLEVKYLQNIKKDLQKDLTALDTLITIRIEKQQASNLILSQIKGEGQIELTLLSRSINLLLFENRFVPNNTTFSELSSSGNLNLISNDTIKNLLLDLQNLYKYNTAGIEHETFDYREYISKPMLRNVKLDILNKILKEEKTAEEMKLTIKDFQTLLNDKSYRNGIVIMGNMSKGFEGAYKNIQAKSLQIINLIDQDLTN